MQKNLIERLSFVKLQPRIILDIGSGTGSLGLSLKKIYPKAHIIHLDEAFQMHKAAKAKKPWFAKFSYLLADLNHLPIAVASFDLIIASGLILKRSEQEAMYQGLLKILKPGGVFMFANFGPDTLQELAKSYASVGLSEKFYPLTDMHNLGDALLARHWQDPVLDTERLSILYNNLPEIYQDLRKLGSHNPVTKPGLVTRQSYKNISLYYQDNFSQENLLPVSIEIIYGLAWAPIKPALQPFTQQIPINII